MKVKSEKIILPILTILGLLFLLPLIVTLTNSFMTETEITLAYNSRLTVFDLVDGITEKFAQLRLIPQSVSFSQYYEVLVGQPSFLVLLTNSVKLALPVALGSLVVSAFTAYGFTIWDFKYKESVFAAYIIVMLMPLQAVLVPNYIVADIFRIKQSYLAIILPGIFSPFGVFLMRQSMKSMPPSYFEAARIDGATDWHIFWQIILPQMKSSVAALLMLVFIEYWNLVEQAVIFIDDWAKEPLSVYLSRLAEGRMGLIFAASCVYMFLPMWFLTLGQKDLEKGIELSGVK